MRRTSTRSAAVLLCGAAIIATAVPANASTRGELVSNTAVFQLEGDQLAAYLTKYQLDSTRARFAVDGTRIVYRTIDAHGKPTTASALVAIPRNNDSTPRHVTWLHGTTAYRGSTASVTDGNDRAAALFFASAGYLTTAPDYLGLGVGPGFHPYVDAPSTVTASVDALRATRKLVAREGRTPDRRVLVTGHSQGGHATMALGQTLQKTGQLGALAPISGPMRPSALVREATEPDTKIANAVAYMAYWTVAWNRIHHLYDDPTEVFNDPSLVDLFDGDHRNEDIFPKLPRTLPELFTPDYLKKVQHPTGVLRAELREADSYCDWRPHVPVTLYTSAGDRDVPSHTSTWCRKRLNTNAKVVDFGPNVDHAKAPKLALPQILATFDRT